MRVADYRPWPSASAGRPWQGRGRGDCSPWPPPGLLMRIRPGPTEVGCNPRRGSRAQLSPLHVAGVADGQCGRTQGQLSRGQKAMGHGCMHLYRRQHRCRVGPGGWAEAISGRKGRRGLREAPNEGHVGLYGATERPIPWHPETQFHPWQRLNIPPVGQDTRTGAVHRGTWSGRQPSPISHPMAAWILHRVQAVFIAAARAVMAYSFHIAGRLGRLWCLHDRRQRRGPTSSPVWQPSPVPTPKLFIASPSAR